MRKVKCPDRYTPPFKVIVTESNERNLQDGKWIGDAGYGICDSRGHCICGNFVNGDECFGPETEPEANLICAALNKYLGARNVK